MNFTLYLKYAGDGSTSQVKSISVETTILSLKQVIAQQNKMNDISTIKVVQRGEILRDTQVLKDLFLNSDGSMTLYVAGIPSKIKKDDQTVEMKFRQGGMFSKYTRKNLIYYIKKHKNGIFGLLILIGLAVGIGIATANSSTQMEMLGMSLEGKSYGFCYLFISVLVVLLISKICYKASARAILDGTILFIKSSLPTFDTKAFLASNGVTF